MSDGAPGCRNTLYPYAALKAVWRTLDSALLRLMPQRGNALQPNVAASATLGNETRMIFNRNAVATALTDVCNADDATALRLKTSIVPFPRVAEAATLGSESQPRWGIEDEGK